MQGIITTEREKHLREETNEQIKEQEMKPGKDVEISSFADLGETLTQVKERLQEYAEQKAVISCDGKTADAQALVEFYECVMVLHRQRLRKSQQKGIEQALKNKAEGNGSYGRPRVKLPEDFQEQIQECRQNNQSLMAYCEQIKMKRSTFYKYVKAAQKKR